MKYLVAYKPCGCPSGDYCELHAHALGHWRHAMEHVGYVVREADFVPDQLVRDGCTHGSLPAQLAAKLREAEAREAGLRKWLRKRIAWENKAADMYVSGWPEHAGRSIAFREVLTKLEGNGQ